ncbi:MAG: cyclic-phosphate processing receiver domain-containing protein [Synergistaceae bacterium]
MDIIIPDWKEREIIMTNKIIKIMVLEDDKERIKVFRSNMEVEGVSLTFTDLVPACISALELCEYDYLFLDHDLGGKTYVPSDGEEKTGWHVAKWLSENPNRKPANIFLHSLNEAGRKNMKSLLPEAVELPFAWKLMKVKDSAECSD